MSRYERATVRFRRPSRVGYLVLVLAGTCWLAACGGSEEPAQGSTSRRQAAETTQAQPDAQAEARAREQQRVDESKREAARLRIESESSLPAPDEELDGLLAQLDQSVAQAESALGSDAGADSQLQQSDRLRRQATDRLVVLNSVEEQKRRVLRERYGAAASQAESLPPDLLMGLDGDIYLTYKHSVVEHVQQALKGVGLYGASVNGELDEETMVSIGRFQQTLGLRVSGVPSPNTRRNLLGDTAG